MSKVRSNKYQNCKSVFTLYSSPFHKNLFKQCVGIIVNELNTGREGIEPAEMLDLDPI